MDEASVKGIRRQSSPAQLAPPFLAGNEFGRFRSRGTSRVFASPNTARKWAVGADLQGFCFGNRSWRPVGSASMKLKPASTFNAQARVGPRPTVTELSGIGE
jgi:hypothetical protein